MGRHRVVIAEDCNEFRAPAGGRRRGVARGLAGGYLAPEGTAVNDYRGRLRALGDGWAFGAPAHRVELLTAVADTEIVLTERDPIGGDLIAVPAAGRVRA